MKSNHVSDYRRLRLPRGNCGPVGSLILVLPGPKAGSSANCGTANGPPGAPLKGGLLWSLDERRIWINWLAVSPAWQGQGVGRRLVEQVLGLVVEAEGVWVVTFGRMRPGERGRESSIRVWVSGPPGIPGGRDRIIGSGRFFVVISILWTRIERAYKL